jgi:hypothetical protein
MSCAQQGNTCVAANKTSSTRDQKMSHRSTRYLWLMLA